ncbi:flagellar FliL protein [Breoghania corrubedonensis]|uniref:Flagellar protein FliL n=1 Tax=Breoghania corrubedonensis TaxID=665038 RepID=A0A2T5V8S7_9HYPH|nr:flagellar basal body-associated FliL family protein [Breoghania corrubedonensis]PTW60153.1 flagellar FliL protein [Breoghania corrubedonensis]
MSETFFEPAPAARTSGAGRAGTFLGFVLLTALAAGAGGLIGLQMVETVRDSVALNASQSARKTSFSPIYVSNAQLRTLMPMVTNLAAPRDTWIRLQASVILKDEANEEASLLVSRIEQDVLAYLRTITLSQIEGAGGLQHLREDLNERAKIRSKGLVRELILESLVVQ